MSVVHISLILFHVGLSVAQLNFFPNLQALQNSKNHLTTEKIDLVIELAIFSDTEFSSRFQHDRQKMVQYWEALMYDTHLRFQTLSSFNISFRVTTLHFLSSTEEENLLLKGIGNGKAYSMKNTLDKFENLLYLNLEQFPKFDISVLVLGTNTLDADGYDSYASSGAICDGRNNQQKKWKSNIVLAMTLPLSETLAENIADVDDEEKYWSYCEPNSNPGRDCCILGSARKYPELKPHYFSHCTNQYLLAIVHTILASKHTYCLDIGTAEKNPVIDSHKLFKNLNQVPAFTIKEQCQILANDINATVDEESEMSCLYPICESALRAQSRGFAPLDGSICGKRGMGRCLRFECFEPHVYVVNVATEKCLVSEQSQFGVNDKPVLKPCSEIPLDLMLGTKIEEDKIFHLTMIYSTEHGPGYKHLMLGENSKMELEATFDTNAGDVRINWMLRRFMDSNLKEFVLMHAITGLCAMVGDNGSDLNFTEDCSGYDLATRWKFERVNGTEYDPNAVYTKGFAYGYFLELYATWIFLFLGVVIMFLIVYLIAWWIYIKPKAEQDQKLKVKKGSATHVVVRGKKVKTKKIKLM